MIVRDIHAHAEPWECHPATGEAIHCAGGAPSWYYEGIPIKKFLIVVKGAECRSMRILFRVIQLAIAAIACGAMPVSGADFVIQISVDGLRPDYLQSVIDAGNAPNFKRFQDEGVWTNNARTDYTHTITLPNHTSMITGRPVSQPAGMPAQTQHGYTSNGNPLPTTTLHNFTTPDWYKASTFDVAHDAGYSTALYASKTKFVLFEQSYNAANGAPNANGSDKIDTFANPENAAVMQSQLLTDIAANHFQYTFIHYADTDDAGHADGWGSASYNAAIARIDGYLGQVFNLVHTDPALAGRTAIVLSADHGGTGTGHGDATLAVDYTIPFYAWGAGVGRGDLYSINVGARTNPGTSRPSYTDAGQPIRNGDGGNLALDLLGLGAIPGSLINAAQNLRVAAPGDFDFDGYVDAQDYVLWRKQLGVRYSESDFAAWRSQFGWTPSGAGSSGDLSRASSVPEPAAIVLLGAVGVLPIVRRRERCAIAP
jgi:hypothetical protein